MMDAPILQVGAGRFISGTRETVLAILHPHRLVVYLVSAVSNNGSINYYSLVQAYEHQMQRPCYSMTYGPMGGGLDRDYICVQSLDGVLSFYEQDSFAFQRMLRPTFLVPGPMAYMAKTDSIVIATDFMTVEAYRYSVLAAAADNVDNANPTGKKVQVDWSTNLGEHARNLVVMRYSRTLAPNKHELVVIGEHSIFCLKENGAIKSMKRVDSQMQCATAYPVPSAPGESADAENLVVGTMSGHLQVYKEAQLIWCARLHHTPVQVEVTQIGGIMGMIVTLSEHGHVQCSYLGTDAPTAALMNTESKELDYPAMEDEHRGLLRVIRQAHGEGAKEEENHLTIMAKVPKDLELVPDEDAGPEVARVDGGVVQMTVQTFLHVTGATEVENVTLVVRTPLCFVLPEKSIFLPRIQNGSPLTLPITFRVSTQHISTRLDIMLAACYSVRGSAGASETR